MHNSFKELVKREAARRGIAKEANAAEICHHFRKLVPALFPNLPEPEKNITSAHFKNGVLTVRTSNPSWAAEVMMRRQQILEALKPHGVKKITTESR